MKVRLPSFPDEIRFTVFGHAIPKQRARVVGGRNKKSDDGKEMKAHAFTPNETVEWESSIYGQSLAMKPPIPWEGGVALGFLIYRKIPRSKSAKFKAAAREGKIRPVGARDDVDNFVKSLKDALNGIYWLDDGQVVEYIQIDGMNPGKYYSDSPRIEVLVRFLKE